MKKRIRIALISSVLGILCAAILLGALAFCIVFGVDAFVVLSTRDRVLSMDAATELDDVDCIIVLGCGLKSDGTPSHMLNDRLEVCLDLYFGLSENGKGTKLLMSGDHGTVEYDEVGAMKQFAIRGGVASSDIFMDLA